MTKNNRFKKVVRAYQNAFNVPYMTALDAVSKPFLVTPEMEQMAEKIRSLIGGGIVLIGGSAGSGKTFFQHYLTRSLGDKRVIEQDQYGEIQQYIEPLYSSNKNVPNSLNVVIPESFLQEKPDFEKFGTYFRLRPDVISLPEFRGSESNEYLKTFCATPGLGSLIVTNIHATSSPSSILNRLIRILVNNTAIQDNSFKIKQFIKNNVKLVIQLDRSFIDGKSMISVSSFEITDEVIEAWSNNNLDNFLITQGYVTAKDKMKNILEKL